MQNKQIISVLYLNQDDDPSALAADPKHTFGFGDSTYLLNVRTGPSDQNDGGKAKNVRGNTEVLYDLPAGENTCIGIIEDREANAAILFIYNDLGNHQINLYKVDDGSITNMVYGPELAFRRDGIVHSANIVDGMIYWTENETNQPRKLNMERAIEVFEHHAIYFSEVPVESILRTVDVSVTRDGLPLVSVTPLLSVATTTAAWPFDFAAACNANTTLFANFEAVVDGSHVLLKAKTPSKYAVTITGTDTYPSALTTPVDSMDLIVNKYYPLTDEGVISLIRRPTLTQPTAAYASDATRNVNLVADRVFQFAIRILYADFERSVMSPWSNVAIPTGGCTTGGLTNNCIDIDFDDPILQSKEWLATIRAVQVVAREVNPESQTFDPIWKIITTLFREDFVLNRSFRFYNDGAYATMAPSDYLRAYDSVPYAVAAQENIMTPDSYRGVLANGVEDFDSPNVPMKLTTTFGEENPLTGQFFTVTGRVYIHAPAAQDGFVSAFPPAIIGYAGGKPARYYQGIHNRGDGIVYGGIGTAAPLPFNPLFADGAEPGVGSDYAQWLPEAGFCIYSAGTPNHTYTEQVRVGSVPVPTGTLNVEQGEKGVFDTSKYGYTLNPENASGRSALRWCMRAQAVYSTFTLQLPVGTNILRMASNLVSRSDAFGEKYNSNNTSLEWQRTSLPLRQFCGIEGTTEFTVTGAAGDVIALDDTYVADLTNPHASIQIDSILGSVQTRGARGYLVDNNALSDIGTVRNGTRLELQSMIVFQREDPGLPAVIPIQNPPTFWERENGTSSVAWSAQSIGYLRTDHNGFAWALQLTTSVTNGLYAGAHGVTANPSSPVAALDVTACTVTDMEFVPTMEGVLLFDFGSGFYTGAPNIFEGVISPASGGLSISHGTALDFIFYNQNGDAMPAISTLIKGKVVTPTGDAVPDQRVMFENTIRFGRTSDTGDYSILVLADAAENLNNRGVTRTASSTYCPFTRDRLVFQSDLLCTTTYISGDAHALQTVAGGTVGITQFEAGQEWSGAVSYPMIDVQALVASGAIASSLLRATTHQVAIMYYDDSGRRTTVGTNDSLILRLPERTADLHGFDPVTYPVGTYRLGAPSVTWSILGSVPLPEHGRFTHYQIGMTADTQNILYLEWIANDALYVKDYDTTTDTINYVSFGSGEANELYISIQNITFAKQQNTDFLPAYTPQEGDKVTLICDRDGNPYLGELTTRVTGQRGEWITCELQPEWPELSAGFMFRISRPAQLTEEKIYYPVGPTFPILDPYGATPSHSATTGTLGADGYVRRRRLQCRPGIDPDRPDAQGPFSILYTCMDYSISDFYPSQEWGRGRENVFNPDARQRRFQTRLRTSGSYAPESNINDLSVYEAGDYNDHSYQWGPIRRLVMVGESLKVVHEKKIVARYPAKPIVTQGVDGTFSAQSDSILGGYHVDKTDYGSVHPCSVVVYGNTAYGFDQLNGLVWRTGYNETFAISSYKMTRFFAQMGQRYSSLDNVTAGFDRRTHEYILCFPAVEASPTGRGAFPASTISFYEDANRWMTFYSYHPEMIGQVNQNVLSSKGGRLWLHNSSSLYNNFYGVQYASELEAVGFSDNQVRKVFNAVEMKASAIWVPALVRVPPSQESRIDSEDFLVQEGDFYAAFWFDLNTPDVANPLTQGDALRGNVIYLLCRLTGSERGTFTSMSVLSARSERTQK